VKSLIRELGGFVSYVRQNPISGRRSTCKSLEELKNWFLDLDIETLLHMTDISPDY
jgi:hypothetical protein